MRQYQRDKGLEVDGIVGTKTRVNIREILKISIALASVEPPFSRTEKYLHMHIATATSIKVMSCEVVDTSGILRFYNVYYDEDFYEIYLNTTVFNEKPH